jgi:hypothetical protein
MKDLISGGSARIIPRLCELFIRKLCNVPLLNLAVFGKVILVEMTKSICIHSVISPLSAMKIIIAGLFYVQILKHG